MSVNQWFMLWILFLSYLFLGAFIFYAIERRYEETRRDEDAPEKLDIEDLLDTYYTWTSNRAHQQLLLKLRQHCNVTVLKPMLKSEDVIEVEDEFQWTFYNSFFFTLTTLSTIGYGNLHPTSCLGRMLVIVYSLVGIPLNGIVLTQLGDFFASTFLRVHRRYKGKHFETRFNLVVDIATYLVPGILLFIFLPSGFFVYFEGWTFEQSIYFAFVTLTTIGYGDYVAGQSTTDTLWYYVYKIVLLFWIMFGLGYLVMILGFISQAMRCKKMTRLEHKLAQNLKHTHSKILNEFNRDVSYVRRLLNELYLLKYKPIYQNEQEEFLHIERKRTLSAPNLTEWPVLTKIPTPAYSSSEDEEETKMMFEKQRMKRRKALSENLFKPRDLRTRSESDLIRIDKNATFNNFTYNERNELMARVSNVLQKTYNHIHQAQNIGESTSNSDEEKPLPRKMSQFEKELRGIDGFSNDEILASEWNGLPDSKCGEYPNNGQLTWHGSESTTDRNKLRLPELPLPASRVKRRSIAVPSVESLRRMSMAALNFLTASKSGKSISKEDDMNKDLESARQKGRVGRYECVRKERYSLCDDYENIYDCLNYYTQFRMKETNIFSALRNQISDIGAGSPVLEQTSIGDVLRIVNSLGTNANEESKTQNSSSPLFTLFQNEISTDGTPDEMSRRKPNSTDSRSRLPNSGHRRYSLVPSQSKPTNVIRNKSFSSHGRGASPSRYYGFRERSASNQMPQIRRIRSEFLPGISSDDAFTRLSSRKIKRFHVKPVTLPASTPAIIVSSPSPNESAERVPCQTSDVCDNDQTQNSRL